jgi:hypothetical protein
VLDVAALDVAARRVLDPACVRQHDSPKATGPGVVGAAPS